MGFFRDRLPPALYELLAAAKDNWIGRPRLSFSSEGEDLILLKYFGKQKTGYYVDVGAAHPKRYSNTYAFYRRGWRGLNVEPNPAFAPLFGRYRKRDMLVQAGVSETAGQLTYYSYEEPEYNTFSEETRDLRRQSLKIEPKTTLTIPTLPLRDILDQRLPQGQKIDFMSVDTEGFDLLVLQTNDWKRYRPRVVLAEEVDSKAKDFWELPTYLFMREQNYTFFAKTFNTLFFTDRTQA